MDDVDNWGWFWDGRLYRNHFPGFFVLTFLQVAIKFFYYDPQVQREIKRSLQEAVSEGKAKLRPEIIEIRKALQAGIREIPESNKEEMREIRESIKALGTPAPRRWLF